MKIHIWDESSDCIVESQAQLDLKTGKISNVVYVPLHDFFNQKENNAPFNSCSYEQTFASMHIKNKNIEFNIDTTHNCYLVKPEDLKNIHNCIKDMGLSIEDLDSTSEKKLKL